MPVNNFVTMCRQMCKQKSEKCNKMFVGKHFVREIKSNCLPVNNLSKVCKQCVDTRPQPRLLGHHIITGALGEKIAISYLKQCGYKILKTNVRYLWGEIDIVAQDNDKILVFIEVKTLDKCQKTNCQSQLKYILTPETRPEDNLSQSKLLKLKKACVFFCE